VAERELAVRSRLPEGYPQPFLEHVTEPGGAAQHARHIVAQLDGVLAGFVVDVVHMVEAGELGHFRRVQPEQAADCGDGLGRQPAHLTLRNIERRSQRGTRNRITGL